MLMAGNANVLVVDDELGPRESLKMILKPYYNVYTAERGVEAIEMLGQVPVDLVTVDLKMPGIPGIKVLEKIKQHDPDIEAIIITGYGSMDTAVEGLRLGAFDYIAKPFDVNQVLKLIRSALERRNARRKIKELKSEFLANISHELRTPLSVVIGFVYLLLDQVVGSLTYEQKRFLEKVYKNSEELLLLIDNALCLTSLSAGDLCLTEEEFDIGMVIRNVAKPYEQILEAKEVRLSIDMPGQEMRIISDLSKMTGIFQNLFHNAVKFTQHGEVTVRASRSIERKRIDLEIVDTGIGMPQDQVERMFQPFRQADSSSRRSFPGLGLGLAVARQLTEFIGGTLQITSQPQVGTHVFLSLPYR